MATVMVMCSCHCTWPTMMNRSLTPDRIPIGMERTDILSPMNQTVSQDRIVEDLRRLPGEFERQSALLVAWPHHNTDWASRLTEVREEVTALILVTLHYQPVILLQDPEDKDPLPGKLIDHPDLIKIRIPFDDTWCRDFGPVGLVSDAELHLVDFEFSAWGKDYSHSKDSEVTAKLLRVPEFRSLVGPIETHRAKFVLEGGAIESNGRGTVLVNWHCLETRHPNMDRTQLITELKRHLCAKEIIGIDVTPHAGDDTDGHIDTLVRFLDERTLVVQGLADESLHQQLLTQVSSLKLLGEDGRYHPPHVVVLPPANDASGLPLNYVNFILINRACLMPVYGLTTDDEALDILSRALPDRDIVPIAAGELITQYGGPHCATMHFPAIKSNPAQQAAEEAA